jgi:hypothetical protein
MSLATILVAAQNKLSINVARAANIETYGLHYEHDWFELQNRQLIINALTDNITLVVLTQDDIDCLTSKLLSPSSCGCS